MQFQVFFLSCAIHVYVQVYGFNTIFQLFRSDFDRFFNFHRDKSGDKMRNKTCSRDTKGTKFISTKVHKKPLKDNKQDSVLFDTLLIFSLLISIECLLVDILHLLFDIASGNHLISHSLSYFTISQRLTIKPHLYKGQNRDKFYFGYKFPI